MILKIKIDEFQLKHANVSKTILKSKKLHFYLNL